MDYKGDDKSDGSLNWNFDPDPITIFKSDNEKIKGNRIIIFDDIERCKINIEELFGFINDFVEHSNCKVILVSDENKIKEKESEKVSYSTFKEKIVGKTFEISSDVNDAIQSFIEQIKSENKNQFKNNESLIIKIFNISGKNNLRVLQRSLFEFERLLELLDSELKDDYEKYPQLVKSLLAYFLIFYIEINTGDSDLSYFPSVLKIDDQKKDELEKYLVIIDSEKLIYFDNLLTNLNLENYIKNALYEDLVKEINKNIFYNPQEQKHWEKLWYFDRLEDDEFIDLIKKVDNDFFENSNLSFTEVLHIAGIYFYYIDESLLVSRSKNEIVERAKQLISLSQDFDYTESYLKKLLRASFGKTYLSNETTEFNNLMDYLKTDFNEKQKQNQKKLVENILNNLNNDTIINLYNLNKEVNVNLFLFFKEINLANFSRSIINLKNENIYSLGRYLKTCYIENEHINNQQNISNQILEINHSLCTYISVFEDDKLLKKGL